MTFVKQSLKAPAYRSALATKDMFVSDVSLWLGFSDIDSVPSIDLQTRQAGALGEIAQGPRKRTEEDPVYPVKPSLLPTSPSASSLKREEHLSWV